MRARIGCSTTAAADLVRHHLEQARTPVADPVAYMRRIPDHKLHTRRAAGTPRGRCDTCRRYHAHTAPCLTAPAEREQPDALDECPDHPGEWRTGCSQCASDRTSRGGTTT